MLNDDRTDRSGGIHYNQFDRVRVETTWKNRLNRERDSRNAAFDAGDTGIFQMNLANNCASGGFLGLKYSHNRLETVTEKEIKQSPQARTSLQGLDPNSMEVLAIKHLAKRPTDKWDLPMTASQESGWLLANPIRASSLLCASAPASSLLPRTLSQPAGRRDREIPPLAVPAMSITTPANERILKRLSTSASAPLLQQRGDSFAEMRNLNNRRWYRPKGKCDVTIYAEAYSNMNHCSPFAATLGR
mmetsp:Transcript_43248/g.92525  ORF Transcript_43248/g.92525 Transcript_43248/m.92525 type:complete len:245 (-) Transcript_43248:7-741(-)